MYRFKWGLILLFLVNLTSCSIIQLTYNHADWLLLKRLDHYFDLTDAQADFLRARLAQHLQWHRQQELPKYVKLLKELKTKAQDGLDGEEINWALTHFQARRRQLFLQLLPDTVYFLNTLSPAQLDYFEQRFIKDFEKEDSEPSTDRATRLAKRAQKIIDHLQDWTGSLNAMQEKQIRALSFALPDVKQAWFNYRQLRRKQLIALLRQKPSPASIQAFLTPWLLEPESHYPPNYRSRFLQMQQAVIEMTLVVDRLITIKQRQHALERLEEYLFILQDLSS